MTGSVATTAAWVLQRLTSIFVPYDISKPSMVRFQTLDAGRCDDHIPDQNKEQPANSHQNLCFVPQQNTHAKNGNILTIVPKAMRKWQQ
jgi:hypothetical protein